MPLHLQRQREIVEILTRNGFGILVAASGLGKAWPSRRIVHALTPEEYRMDAALASPDGNGVEVAYGVEQLCGGQAGPAFQQPGDEQGEEAEREVGLDMGPGPDVDRAAVQVRLADPERLFDAPQLAVSVQDLSLIHISEPTRPY